MVNSFTNNADGSKTRNTIEILPSYNFYCLVPTSLLVSHLCYKKQDEVEVESPTFIGTMTFLYLINSKFFGKMTIDINQ